MIKKLFSLISLTLTLTIVKADYWTQKNSFTWLNGPKTSDAFVINNKAYALSRFIFSNTNSFYEYDNMMDAWTQKADYPLAMESAKAAGFAIGNKGYIGLGMTAALASSKLLFEYDPVSNNWTQKSNFPSTGRTGAFSFVIGTKAYVGCGFDSLANLLDDMWEYDQVTDAWTQKTNYPYSEYDFSGHSYLGKGYLAYGNLMTNETEMWEYDPTFNVWVQKASCHVPYKYYASFILNDVIYIGMGFTGSFPLNNDFWSYNITNNSWHQVATFPALERFYALTFSIGNKGYLGFGDNGPGQADFWEYTPDSTTNIEENLVSNFQFTISPNPVQEVLVISWLPIVTGTTENKNVEIVITTLEGKKVFSKQLENKTSNFKLQTSNFPKGIYLVQIISNKKISGTQKLIVE